MSNICPLMSRPVSQSNESFPKQMVVREEFVECLKENCAFWICGTVEPVKVLDDFVQEINVKTSNGMCCIKKLALSNYGKN